MTISELTSRRNDFQLEMQTSIRNVRRTWLLTNILFWFIKSSTLLLATLVASEPLLKNHIKSPFFWDICGVLVLLFLLFDLGVRPGETRRGHLNFVSEAEVVAREISLVDPERPDALDRLSELNRQREMLMEKHRAETG